MIYIDQWSPNIVNKYPCGEIKNKPYVLKSTSSKYLVIAGDISDNIHESINFLNEISKYYEMILFVDGNHEHVGKYPELYNTKYINSLIKNDKIQYLPEEPFRINNTVFIGACGWWDYDNSNLSSIENNKNYFKNWIPHFTESDNVQFIDNVIEESKKQFDKLNNLILKYSEDLLVDNIVIVTHTLPNYQFCNGDTSSESQYETITSI